MSRRDESLLGDIDEAIAAIRSHLTVGGLDSDLVYDAVRVRLIEIGEAVKGLDPDLVATEPVVEWRAIAQMRDHLAHRYFDTDRAVVQDVVDNELGPLSSAVDAMRQRLALGTDDSADKPES